MLPAQIYHKVPSDFEGMEDVLTSSVFALLRYLPAQLACHLLTKWAKIPVQRDWPEVDFWPRYPTPAGFHIFIDTSKSKDQIDRGRTEPDVMIRTQEWLVLVEVKYQSHLDPAYDQLSREFAIGYRLAKDEGRRFRLLVVTANTLEPRPGGVELKTGVRQALTQVRDAGGSITQEMIASVPDSLRWTSWHQVYKTVARISATPYVAEHNRQLLGDVCQLLEMRGLKPYTSRPLADVMKHWESVGIPEDAWRLPIPYHYNTAS